MKLYQGIMNMAAGAAWLIGTTLRQKPRRKFMRFVYGQKGLVRHIADTFCADGRPVVWVHASSLGEYGIARPMIAEMRSRGWRVVMTFFSPTGYEALESRHPEIDNLYYLPLDTCGNARRFLDIVRPDKAVFMVSEYWMNYLTELKRRDIDTYLVSAKLTDEAACFKWYGGMYRRCLDVYRRIFVIDEQSRYNLSRLGHGDKVEKSGNPLFDNAIAKAAEQWSDPVLDAFCRDDGVMVAGSIHDEHDLRMVCDLANLHPDRKFVFIPHEVGESMMLQIENALAGNCARYSRVNAKTGFDGVQVLIIDFVGALAYIYRYGTLAYVGGGFTRYLHSLVEATVYGLPVSFGPNTNRKATPLQLQQLGLGTIVRDSDELQQWYASLIDNTPRLELVRRDAARYVKENSGVTAAIVDKILK